MGGAAIRKIIDGRVYISARGASKLLGVSAKSVENWARQGKTGTGLPFEAKLTSTMRILVPLEAVDSLLTADASYKGPAVGTTNSIDPSNSPS